MMMTARLLEVMLILPGPPQALNTRLLNEKEGFH